MEVEDDRHEIEEMEINMNVRINELEKNGEMMEVENNSHEIEEMEEEVSDKVISDESCFESDMENDVTETTYRVLNQA